MFKRFALISLVAGCCPLLSCTIEFPGDGGPTGGGPLYVPLDQAEAVITIRETPDQAAADVQARITTRLGLAVLLQRGQEVSVNSVPLTGPDSGGVYHASIPLQATYTVSVLEPTRGAQDTAIGSPAGFAITAPAAGAAASLSGFTVSWSNPDPSLTVLVTLTQTIFGDETTHDFGPVADTGSQSFSPTDLADFRQGADLLVSVTRRHEPAAVAGFHTGTVSIEHTETVAVHPGP